MNWKFYKSNSSFFCFIILLILIVIFFSRLFYPHLSVFITPDFGLSDLLHGYYPIRYLLSESLKNNEILLWTGLVAGGYPIFADGQIGTFYLPHLLLYKTLPFFLALNISYILTFFIGGLGTFFLAKELKLPNLFSLLAAIIFTFSGFNIFQITHISILEAGSLLPWILFLFEKLYQKIQIKLILLLSLVISQLIFIGHQEITVYSLMSIVIYSTSKIIFTKQSIKKMFRSLFTNYSVIFLTTFIAIILSAVLILSSLELFLISSSRGISNNQINHYSFNPQNFMNFINPFFLGSPKDGTYQTNNINKGIFWENNGYVGILPMILLPFVVLFLKQVKIKVILFILIISLLLVLGKNSILSFLFNLPPLNYFRVPSRFLILTDLALALLSPMILFEIFTKIKISNHPKNILVILIGILQTVNIFYYLYYYHPIGEADKWLNKQEIINILQNDKTDFRIFTIENFTDWNNIFFKEGWINQDKYLAFQHGLMGHTNLFFNLPKINPFVLFQTDRMAVGNSLINFQKISENNDAKLISSASAKLLGLNNVKYLVVPKTFRIQNLDLSSEFSDYLIYKNPYFLDRARVVYNTININKLDKKNLNNFDPQKEAIIENELDSLNNTCDDKCVNSINWLKNKDGEIEILVYSDKKGLLTLADTVYPGWHAYLDDLETNIYPVNINQKAIIIDAGTHKVRFVYRPLSFIIGSTISELSYIIVLILLLRPYMQKIIRYL